MVMRFRKGKNREQRNYLFFGAQGQKRSDHYGWKGIYVQLYKYTVCDVSCGKGTSNSARESKDSPKIRTHVQTSSMERLGLFCLNPYLIISRTKLSDNSEQNIRSGTYSWTNQSCHENTCYKRHPNVYLRAIKKNTSSISRLCNGLLNSV
jgi:hypothetical protein